MMPEDMMEPPSKRDIRRARREEITDGVAGGALGEVVGREMPFDQSDLLKTLEFYYEHRIPDKMVKHSDDYFAYTGKELPVSNLSQSDDIWIIAYLRDLQLMRLKFGPVRCNIDVPTFDNNMIVDTKANIGMGKDGFARKLDKSFQIGWGGDKEGEAGGGAAKKRGFFGRFKP